MVPVIAIIGRPNVGKSTLFNCLTRSRTALVADYAGLTRDRLYGHAVWSQQAFITIDTGGLERLSPSVTGDPIVSQTLTAIEEADGVVLVVDGRVGLTVDDRLITRQLQRQNKPLLVAVNKVEAVDVAVAALADFYSLGIGENLVPIAAAHGMGISLLVERLSTLLDITNREKTEDDRAATHTHRSLAVGETSQDPRVSAKHPIRIALAGRPNVGKSTLVNYLLGSERMVVADQPGTTRDSVTNRLQWQGETYELVDTAGVRKRAKVSATVEKFSVVKTLQAIEQAHVVLLILDGAQGVGDQDLALLDFILMCGRAVVIAVNKWDSLAQTLRAAFKSELAHRMRFVDFIRIHYISALKGEGINPLWRSIKEAYLSATRPISTTRLTQLTLDAQKIHLPPLVHGRRVKLKYAHIGGYNPPLVVVHGNQVAALPEAYQRYLIHAYRHALKIYGTPIVLRLQQADNPYKAQRNLLTHRQIRKRQRLLRYHRRKNHS